ncbi:MAG: hypothetical protein O3A53_02315 [Acidobacteria bacterium]|nr:hypothetical protein [Acidobacteriota bacterium]MDA1233616.1 hypothetical protein [Acidobacteriota bacterium]
MRMKISSFLGWGGKRENADERRKEPRYAAEGPMKVYWRVDGGFTSARGQLHDAGEGGSGLGFTLSEPILVGTAAWITTSEGETFGGIVRHADARDGVYLIGAKLDLQSKIVEGWGGVQLRWISDEQLMHVASASLRNGAEAMLEVNCAEAAPVGVLLLITGPEVSCLCFVKECRPYGKIFLLEVEAVADATEQPRANAA